jgi:hypothetical protein
MTRRTVVPWRFCRKRNSEVWLAFFVFVLLLSLANALAADNENKDSYFTIHEGDEREKLSKTTGFVNVDSKFLPKESHDFIQTKIQKFRRLQNDTNEINNETGLSTTAIVYIVIISILGGTAVLLTIVSSVLVYVHRKNSVVAIGQPPCK